MGWWAPEPQLEPGERVLHVLKANRSQGGRSVGGRLVVTDRALRFVACHIDRRLAGRDWTARRDQVASVSAVPPGTMPDGPAAGGLTRTRLCVSANGSDELFVVRDARRQAVLLHAWLSAAQPR